MAQLETPRQEAEREDEREIDQRDRGQELDVAECLAAEEVGLKREFRDADRREQRRVSSGIR
jgi:hypothetical protein